MSRRIFEVVKPHVEKRVEEIRDDPVPWLHYVDII